MLLQLLLKNASKAALHNEMRRTNLQHKRGLFKILLIKILRKMVSTFPLTSTYVSFQVLEVESQSFNFETLYVACSMNCIIYLDKHPL